MRVRELMVAVLGLLVAAPAAGAIPLERGGMAFWSGGGEPGACGPRCWEYTLELAPDGHRLRVGLDRHAVAGSWTLTVGGTTAGPRVGLYSSEILIDRPAAGAVPVRVEAGEAVEDLRFRVRAKLEREPVVPDAPVDELPNLQALPPWDLTFDYPVTNGMTDPPQGMPLPGGRIACHAEEVLEEGAVRCLRMAFGVRNTGRGPMELFLGDGSEPDDRPLIQRVRRSDGSSYDRDAGLARFHTTHAHYHHDQAIGLELLAMGADGSLKPAAAEHRKGFAHRNEMMREWHMFHPTWSTDGFGLTAGWGDYYEWDRPGNYVDFGLNPDGRYVLRLTVDPVGGILESNEADNAGYSVIDVKGETVTLLESGRGSGPGDRCRILVPLGPEPELPPGFAQHPRPADCPLDTVDPDPSPPPMASAIVRPLPQYVPAAPAAVKKKAKAKKRCPRVRKGMSRKRRAAVRRCRARQRRAARRRARSGRDTASRRPAGRR